jgi:drug/metabolite transporter (DMT)-like permease
MKLNVRFGVLLTLISALAYAISSAIIKSSPEQLPVPFMVFFQSIWALLLWVAIILPTQKANLKQIFVTNNLKLQIFRAMLSLGISYLFFYSLKYIHLVDAALLANSAPLMVPVLALLFFKQAINHRLWLPLICGFLGVVIVLRPSSDLFHPAAFLALGVAVCTASSMMAVRTLSNQDGTLTSVFYYFLLSSIISGVVLLFFLEDLYSANLMLLLVVGSLFFIVQYFVTWALEHANTQVVSISYYSCVIFAAFFGWWFFNTPIDIWVILGILLICGSGIVCISIQTRGITSENKIV